MSDAIVMGAGFGGIAAALRLKKLGHNVLLIDNGDEIGGRARVLQKNGYTFDLGPTVITAPHLFGELFSLFGKKIEDYVAIKPLDLWYRFLFDSGEKLDYGYNLESLLNEIAAFNPGDVAGYKKLLAHSEKIFDIGFTKLATHPFLKISDMIKVIPDLVHLQSYRSVYSTVSHYIKSPELRRAFSIHPLLVGGNPFQTTSIYCLIHALERKWGIHFPMGGTGALVQALKKLCQEVGVEIVTKSQICSAEIQNNTLKHVTDSTGNRYEASLFVSNMDPAYFYQNVIPPKNCSFFEHLKVSRSQYSMGLFVIYFGTKKQYHDIAHHMIIFGKTYKELLDSIYKKGSTSLDLSLYLHRPTATDPTLAPQGCDAFYCLAPVPNLKKNIDNDTFANSVKEKVLSILEEKALPDLSSYIDTMHILTPKSFYKEYLSLHGAGFSIAPRFSQSAWFRFHNRDPHIANLYHVGAGTHPGAGLPGVLSSAKVVENLLTTKL